MICHVIALVSFESRLKDKVRMMKFIFHNVMSSDGQMKQEAVRSHLHDYRLSSPKIQNAAYQIQRRLQKSS